MVVNSVDMFVNRCWLHNIAIYQILTSLSFGSSSSVSIKIKRKGQTFDERVAADTHTANYVCHFSLFVQTCHLVQSKLAKYFMIHFQIGLL